MYAPLQQTMTISCRGDLTLLCKQNLATPLGFLSALRFRSRMIRLSILTMSSLLNMAPSIVRASVSKGGLGAGVKRTPNQLNLIQMATSHIMLTKSMQNPKGVFQPEGFGQKARLEPISRSNLDIASETEFSVSILGQRSVWLVPRDDVSNSHRVPCGYRDPRIMNEPGHSYWRISTRISCSQCSTKRRTEFAGRCSRGG